MLSHLNQVRVLRRIVLPLFARFNPGDVHIRHHWTGDRIRLHSYRHKGYWFHGRRRERETLDRLAHLLNTGDTVFEIGGHIGYLTLYFAKLVGAGSVHVFEPGANNLPYLRENVAGHPSIKVVEKGVGDESGLRQFFTEDLTGQNNSFLADYHVFEENRAMAYATDARYHATTVPMITLDDYVAETGTSPDLVKIDVEGFELEVLRGATKLLRERRPRLMVEVTRRSHEVLELLRSAGYEASSPEGAAVGEDVFGNVFFLPR